MTLTEDMNIEEFAIRFAKYSEKEGVSMVGNYRSWIALKDRLETKGRSIKNTTVRHWFACLASKCEENALNCRK